MNARTATILRLDGISSGEFIKAVNLTVESSPEKVLLPDRKLNDLCISFTRKLNSGSSPEANGAVDYHMYLILEDELLQKSRDRYIVIVSDAKDEDNIQKLALQIRDLLLERNIVSYFRIDPQQGLVLGSPNNTISPYFGDPKPKVGIVLYLVNDISHPGIATYEYVERKYRREYIKLFKRVNGHIPKRLLKIFYSDILSLRKRKESYLLRHRDIAAILDFLTEQKFEDIRLSILYENLSQYELDNLAFDTISASYLFKGQGKFFNAVDDLLDPEIS